VSRNIEDMRAAGLGGHFDGPDGHMLLSCTILPEDYETAIRDSENHCVIAQAIKRDNPNVDEVYIGSKARILYKSGMEHPLPLSDLMTDVITSFDKYGSRPKWLKEDEILTMQWTGSIE
jgi:hypothetical protein